MTEGRGRPPRSSLCVCCGQRTYQQAPFHRSSARFYGDPIPIPICPECERLVGRRQFLSVASMRGFVQGHLARRHEPFQLPAAEDVARLPAGTRSAAMRVIRDRGTRNARKQRRLAYDPTARKRA